MEEVNSSTKIAGKMKHSRMAVEHQTIAMFSANSCQVDISCIS